MNASDLSYLTRTFGASDALAYLSWLLRGRRHIGTGMTMTTYPMFLEYTEAGASTGRRTRGAFPAHSVLPCDCCHNGRHSCYVDAHCGCPLPCGDRCTFCDGLGRVAVLLDATPAGDWSCDWCDSEVDQCAASPGYCDHCFAGQCAACRGTGGEASCPACRGSLLV